MQGQTQNQGAGLPFFENTGEALPVRPPLAIAQGNDPLRRQARLPRTAIPIRRAPKSIPSSGPLRSGMARRTAEQTHIHPQQTRRSLPALPSGQFKNHRHVEGAV
ncbi:hypothetical protein AFERRID_10090 [Acidithiobacillus ferridurans]|uniref:Uncharacterized protein n=1 Tax=Acidithiobacillus ferridurans TaxID=1232575 RepID=A0A2Z6IGI1_ACIFI|nr:hypothetical protein AFERRID_10090 [Acidithiobacillus ferridurans]